MRSYEGGPALAWPALVSRPGVSTGVRRETAEATPASSDAPLHLARTAAHQINSSLSVVLGNVALLLTQLDPDSDAHTRAWRALTEAKRVREIVDDIMRVTRGVTSDRR